LSENLHANTADSQMEQWLQHIPISFETVKVEDLNRMIIESQPFVTVATATSTKGLKWIRINGFNSLRMLTAIQSDGYLTTGILKSYD
jgi:DNA mismatch repair protein MutH